MADGKPSWLGRFFGPKLPKIDSTLVPPPPIPGTSAGESLHVESAHAAVAPVEEEPFAFLDRKPGGPEPMHEPIIAAVPAAPQVAVVPESAPVAHEEIHVDPVAVAHEPLPVNSLSKEAAIAHVEGMHLDELTHNHMVDTIRSLPEGTPLHLEVIDNVAHDTASEFTKYGPNWLKVHGNFASSSTADALVQGSALRAEMEHGEAGWHAPAVQSHATVATAHGDTIATTAPGEAPITASAEPPPVPEPSTTKVAPPPAVKGAMTADKAEQVLKGVKPETITGAVADVKEFNRFQKFAGAHSTAIGAGGAGLMATAFFIPNKTVQNADGTQSEKWGAGKTAVFAGGTAITTGAIASKLTWGAKLKIAEAAAFRTLEQGRI